MHYAWQIFTTNIDYSVNNGMLARKGYNFDGLMTIDIEFYRSSR